MAYNPLMNTQAFTAIRIAPGDDVAVALRDLAPGDICCGHDFSLPAAQAVAAGHKVALRAIVPGERVCKYGAPIGVAAKAIARGEWVHTHNLRSDLGGVQAYQWRASPGGEVARASASFSGFMRADGRVGVRNGVWILPTVGCVNERAARIAAAARPFVHGSVDAVTAFPILTAARRWRKTRRRSAARWRRLQAIPTRAACCCSAWAVKTAA